MFHAQGYRRLAAWPGESSWSEPADENKRDEQSSPQTCLNERVACPRLSNAGHDPSLDMVPLTGEHYVGQHEEVGP